jgi:DNA invertase Pin-like site-specific DNA recombinase
MASLKQRLELAAVRLADAKNMLAAAQKEFDELFRLASDRGAKGAKAKPASPPPVEAVPQGRIKDLVAQILLQAPLRPHRYQEIAAKLQTTPATVRAILNKMRAAGQAERDRVAGPSMWRAVVTRPTAVPGGMVSA